VKSMVLHSEELGFHPGRFGRKVSIQKELSRECHVCGK